MSDQLPRENKPVDAGEIDLPRPENRYMAGQVGASVSCRDCTDRWLAVLAERDAAHALLREAHDYLDEDGHQVLASQIHTLLEAQRAAR